MLGGDRTDWRDRGEKESSGRGKEFGELLIQRLSLFPLTPNLPIPASFPTSMGPHIHPQIRVHVFKYLGSIPPLRILHNPPTEKFPEPLEVLVNFLATIYSLCPPPDSLVLHVGSTITICPQSRSSMYYNHVSPL